MKEYQNLIAGIIIAIAIIIAGAFIANAIIAAGNGGSMISSSLDSIGSAINQK
jgi:hypothetical protein